MELLVDRRYKKNEYTIGSMYVNGRRFSDTLEDKDRGLSNNMSEFDILRKKVYGRTAIPTGTYIVKLTYSQKFAGRAWGRKYGGLVPEIRDVKGFSGIRIHPGNTSDDSLGCIFPGKNDIKGRVSQSTVYYYRLMDDYLMPAHKKGEEIKIQVR